MFARIKTGKRRVYQDVVHKLFKTEETTSDEEFEKARLDFFELERELIKLLKSVKELQESTRTLSARTASTSCLLAAQLNSDHSEDSAKTSAKILSDNLSRSHNAVYHSCQSIIDKHVIQLLQHTLKVEFPMKKKKLASHEGLRKDLESYRRRKKKLQEKGRSEDDNDMAKILNKLGRTQNSYTQMHTELLQDLTQTYANRHKLMQSIYCVLVVCQGTFHKEYTKSFDVLGNLETKDDAIEGIRFELNQLINNGGPTPEELQRMELARTERNMVNKLKRSLSSFKLSKRSRQEEPQAAPPVDIPSSPQPPMLSDNQSRESSETYTPGVYSDLKSPDSNGSAFQQERIENMNAGSRNEEKGLENGARPQGTSTGVASAQSSELNVERVIAEHEYMDGDENDLKFSKGDIITVLQRIDDGWWEGRLDDGSVGWFPVTYVRPLEESEAKSVTVQ